MEDLNVIYPMKDRRGTPQETIQAESGLWGKLSFLGNIFCQALYVFFFYFLPICMASDDDFSISSSLCCVPYVIPAKNGNFMASMFIDHRRANLKTS